MEISETSLEGFAKYCWDFYGPDGIYGQRFFNGTLTQEELSKAVQVVAKWSEFDGADSLCREMVRDCIWFNRGVGLESLELRHLIEPLLGGDRHD